MRRDSRIKPFCGEALRSDARSLGTLTTGLAPPLGFLAMTVPISMTRAAPIQGVSFLYFTAGHGRMVSSSRAATRRRFVYFQTFKFGES